MISGEFSSRQTRGVTSQIDVHQGSHLGREPLVHKDHSRAVSTLFHVGDDLGRVSESSGLASAFFCDI